MTCRCDFGTGLKICHCAGCHETFTSITAFDLHQRINDDGLTCLDPAGILRRNGEPALAVLRLTPDGCPVWGWNAPRRYWPDRAGITRQQESEPLAA